MLDHEYLEAQDLFYFLGGMKLLKLDEEKETKLRQIEAARERVYMTIDNQEERTRALAQIYRQMVVGEDEEHGFNRDMINEAQHAMDEKGERLFDKIIDRQNP